MSSVYVTAEGLAVRVVGNNLLVVPDPAPKQSAGGLHLPAVNSLTLHATGRVVAVGHLTGKRAPRHTSIPGISVGDRVLYLRLLGKTDANPQVQKSIDEEVVRIRPADVLLVLDGEDWKRVQ